MEGKSQRLSSEGGGSMEIGSKIIAIIDVLEETVEGAGCTEISTIPHIP